MKLTLKPPLLVTVGVWAVLLAATACVGGPSPSNSTLEVPSGRNPNASVSGAVTYRERLSLTPGATLQVELRDVSYADAAAPLIARQTISDPGQVPIKFKVEYNRKDIDSRNLYSISARIIESDGRLAFINDTAYEVITRGNPDKVDLLLVLVQPPPDPSGDAGSSGSAWVEVPVPVISANLIPDETEALLRVDYYQSSIEGCARPGNQELEVDRRDVIMRLTLMQPPPTSWGIPCHEQVVELDAIEPIREKLEHGQTYRVIVNDTRTTTFTLPEPGLGHTFVTESAIESARLVVQKGSPHQYRLLVTSGMPKGSGCSQFNGYEIRRPKGNTLEVTFTHHEVADPSVFCIADYPVVETTVPLGSDFEPGVEYTVVLNSEIERKFTATQ